GVRAARASRLAGSTGGRCATARARSRSSRAGSRLVVLLALAPWRVVVLRPAHRLLVLMPLRVGQLLFLLAGLRVILHVHSSIGSLHCVRSRRVGDLSAVRRGARA